MEVWKKFTKEGNALYQSFCWHAAESQYQCAKTRAENLLMSWADPEEAVAALVVSYQNLAEVYGAMGLHLKQQKELQAAHCCLLTALQSNDLTNQQIDAILGGVNRTYMALLAHLKNRLHATGSLSR